MEGARGKRSGGAVGAPVCVCVGGGVMGHQCGGEGWQRWEGVFLAARALTASTMCREGGGGEVRGGLIWDGGSISKNHPSHHNYVSKTVSANRILGD